MNECLPLKTQVKSNHPNEAFIDYSQHLLMSFSSTIIDLATQFSIQLFIHLLFTILFYILIFSVSFRSEVLECQGTYHCLILCFLHCLVGKACCSLYLLFIIFQGLHL